MTLAWILVFTAGPKEGGAVRDWFEGAPAAVLSRLPGLEAFDLYVPAGDAADPYLDDGPGPVLQAQLYFPDVAALEAALTEPAVREHLVDRPGCPAGAKLATEAMEVRFFPVAAESTPARLTAPVSYVVRYHRPAEDEAAFIRHYLSHHPPILGRFPRIRNVICYIPVNWADPLGLPNADYMLGNEVVFDSLDDLNAALNSEVRHELREDYKTFPPFSGRNTHYAMKRKRIA